MSSMNEKQGARAVPLKDLAACQISSLDPFRFAFSPPLYNYFCYCYISTLLFIRDDPKCDPEEALVSEVEMEIGLVVNNDLYISSLKLLRLGPFSFLPMWKLCENG